jgi:glycosyltransferase involved in cell wall biosynthesis
MRFVLVSTHTDQITGYSKVAYNLLKQLAALAPKIKVFHFGFQRHPGRTSIRKPIEGVVQYDAAANEDPKEEGFGFNKIHEYLDMVNPDVVMIYNDPLIIHKFIEAMKHNRASSPYKLWAYVDQVYEGISSALMSSLRDHLDRVYCFTDIWKQKFLSYGPFPDVRVMEHAVDKSTSAPASLHERKLVRSNMAIPANGIVFLNTNRNSQRKRLDLTVMGFVRLLERNPGNSFYLVMATNLNPQSGAYYDLGRVFMTELERASLPQDLMTRLVLIDTSPPNVVNDEGIHQLYSVADVGVNTSDGEGFGLCQLEHLCVGAPQVVTDIGSFRSFLDETVAAFVPPSYRSYFPGGMPLGGWAPTFDPDKIAEAMERVVSSLETMKSAAASYPFKTWSAVCDGFLEDVLSA